MHSIPQNNPGSTQRRTGRPGSTSAAARRLARWCSELHLGNNQPPTCMKIAALVWPGRARRVLSTAPAPSGGSGSGLCGGGRRWAPTAAASAIFIRPAARRAAAGAAVHYGFGCEQALCVSVRYLGLFDNYVSTGTMVPKSQPVEALARARAVLRTMYGWIVLPTPLLYVLSKAPLALPPKHSTAYAGSG